MITQDELDDFVNDLLEAGENNERRGSEEKAC